MRWSTNPLPELEALTARYGDPWSFRMPNGNVYAFVTSPDLIHDLFAEAVHLDAGEGHELHEPLIGAHSVVRVQGEKHQRVRRVLTPPFQAKRMDLYFDSMLRLAESVVASWSVDTSFALRPELRRITSGVILRTVFGLEGAHLPEIERLSLSMLRMLDKLSAPAAANLYFAFMGVVPHRPRRTFYSMARRFSFIPNLAQIERTLYSAIAERRQASDLGARTDVLSILLGHRDEAGRAMAPEELRDHLMTLLVAGYETTASSLAWASEEILSAPEVEEKVRRELEDVVGEGPLTPEHLPRLVYLDAVIRETLRRWPPFPLIVRQTRGPYPLGRYILPGGTFVVMSPYLTHRRPDLFPEPDRFLPERFLGGRLDPTSWLPFGGGIRRCIGMALALYEMKIVLATLLSRLELRLVDEPCRLEQRGVLIVPAGGTKVRITRRRHRIREGGRK